MGFQFLFHPYVHFFERLSDGKNRHVGRFFPLLKSVLDGIILPDGEPFHASHEIWAAGFFCRDGKFRIAARFGGGYY